MKKQFALSKNTSSRDFFLFPHHCSKTGPWYIVWSLRQRKGVIHFGNGTPLDHHYDAQKEVFLQCLVFKNLYLYFLYSILIGTSAPLTDWPQNWQINPVRSYEIRDLETLRMRHYTVLGLKCWVKKQQQWFADIHFLFETEEVKSFLKLKANIQQEISAGQIKKIKWFLSHHCLFFEGFFSEGGRCWCFTWKFLLLTRMLKAMSTISSYRRRLWQEWRNPRNFMDG